jgi:exopolysaccharide production protein ExoF
MTLKTSPTLWIAHAWANLLRNSLIKLVLSLPNRRHARLWSHAAKRSVALAVLLGFWAVPAAAQSNEEYKLQLQDKIHVAISEWMPSRLAFRDWTAVNGDYLISPDGTLALPFVGQVSAVGKNTSQVRQAVLDGLAKVFPVLGSRDVTISVTQYAPFYVIGDVRVAGPYAFVPGLTVLQAIGVAGGFRVQAETLGAANKDAITAAGQVGVLTARRAQLLAQQARLEAEEQKLHELSLSNDLAGLGVTQSMIDQQGKILVADNSQLQAQVQHSQEAADLLDSEIKALTAQSVSLKKLMDARQADLDRIEGLVDQGIVVASRSATLEQVISDLTIRLIELDSEVFEATEKKAEALQGIQNAQNSYLSTIATAMQSTSAEIAEVGANLQMNQALLDSASATAAVSVDGQPSASVEYAISRRTGDGYQQIPANEGTVLQPADVLRVVLHWAVPK